MALRVPYEIVDVFTSEPFGGNQLAVITDGRGLDTAQMAKIAAEFNFSETTFVLPPKDPSNTAHVRIFTPASELPFAGHPNVGTAYVLARAGKTFGPIVDDLLKFEEGAGLVPVRAYRDGGLVMSAELTAPRELNFPHPKLDPALLAECIGLGASDIVGEPTMASVGLAFALVAIRDIDALARAVTHEQPFRVADKRYPDPHSLAIYAYVRQSANAVTARMFAPLSNIREDPATGSAAGALAAYLASRSVDGEHKVTISQGAYAGRPSTLFTMAIKSGSQVRDVRVRGNCAAIASGTLTLP